MTGSDGRYGSVSYPWPRALALFLAASLAVMVSGCQRPGATVTSQQTDGLAAPAVDEPSVTEPALTESTAEPGPTPLPSQTPAPTASPSSPPTSTPEPSPTPEPTKEPTPAPMSDLRISPEAGALAPDLTLPDLDGNGVVTLSDLRGKPVLLNFWTTW